MLQVLTSRPRRRPWSSRTVAVSVGAHVLLLSGAVYAVASALVQTELPQDSVT